MKLHNKLSMGIILGLAILLVNVVLVNAQPPLGTGLQKYPYESKPGAYVATGTAVTGGAQMNDGIVGSSGFFYLGNAVTWPYDGNVEFNTFGSPATTFTIGWVEIKIKYGVVAHADDAYRWEYTTDGVTWIVLQPLTSSAFDSAGVAQIRSWSQVLPNDSTWDWTDISNLKVRIYFHPQSWIDYVFMYVFDVWVDVYPLPAPPTEPGPTISIQPSAVETLPMGPPFFVEVYAENVTNLAGYQITFKFNTTVLFVNPIPWAYYPFTDVATAVYDDPNGYVSLSYSIPIADPLSSTGVNGSMPLARIYFGLQAPTMGPLDWSFLYFNVSILGDKDALPMPHGEYHGVYGTPPPGIALMGWLPASPFPWGTPITTEWLEQWPNFGQIWHLASHEDNQEEPEPDGYLNPSDQIDMIKIEPPDEDVYWWHVDEIWETDLGLLSGEGNVFMILTFKYSEPVPEFPLGLGLMMILALLIPTAYIWRLRKKVTK